LQEAKAAAAAAAEERETDRPTEWMGQPGGSMRFQGTSPSRGQRKPPIKIEGYENHIKDNPFLHK
jgi:hypothetical protein